MNLRKLYFFSFGLAFALLFLSAWFVKRPNIGAATFSPDGQYLVFSIYAEGRESIYRIRKDGTELKRLTSSSGNNFEPVYSPDGSRIVFAQASSANYGADADLYIMNLDGSSQTRLTSGPAHDTSPVFSPDGKQIYFVRARWFGHHSPFVSSSWHDLDLYSIGVDGTALKQITDNWYYEMSRPSVSPDGKHILVRISIDENPDSLWIISLQDHKIMQAIRPILERYKTHQTEKPWATEPLRYDDLYYPQFSPDGKSIIFKWSGHYQGYFAHEIYVMDLATKDTKRLTDLKSYIRWPSFSPDGKEIVFLCNRKGTDSPSELWIVNSDGTNAHRVNVKL